MTTKQERAQAREAQRWRELDPMTKEQRTAFIIGGRAVIEAEIAQLTKLRQQTVGWLYPAILAGDIADLRVLLDQVPKERTTHAT